MYGDGAASLAGLTLATVNGKSVVGIAFKDAIQEIRKSARPLTLALSAAPASASIDPALAVQDIQSAGDYIVVTLVGSGTLGLGLENATPHPVITSVTAGSVGAELSAKLSAQGGLMGMSVVSIAPHSQKQQTLSGLDASIASSIVDSAKRPMKLKLRKAQSIDVQFTQPGSLGLQFTPADGKRSCATTIIGGVKPGTQAASHPELRPGLVLCAVGGVAVGGRGYKLAIDTIKQSQQRPLTLSFAAAATGGAGGGVTSIPAPKPAKAGRPAGDKEAVLRAQQAEEAELASYSGGGGGASGAPAQRVASADAVRAAQAAEEAALAAPPPATSSPISVVFTEQGTLGLRFKPVDQKGAAPGATLARAMPGTQAEKHAELKNAAGLILLSLESGGKSIDTSTLRYSGVIDAIKSCGRPLKMTFGSSTQGGGLANQPALAPAPAPAPAPADTAPAPQQAKGMATAVFMSPGSLGIRFQPLGQNGADGASVVGTKSGSQAAEFTQILPEMVLVAIEAHGKSVNVEGTSYQGIIERLRNAPRPLKLTFKNPTTPEATPAPAPAPTTPAPAPASTAPTALSVIETVFSTWSAGGYLAAGTGDAAIASHFGKKCVLHANVDGYSFAHTSGYKLYHGVAGAKEWLLFLTELEFPDFEVVKMKSISQYNVAVTVSYTPTVKATGNSATSKLQDTQEWVVEDGKVARCKFHWSKPSVLDSLFAAVAPPTAAAPAPASSGPVPGSASPEEGVPPTVSHEELERLKQTVTELQSKLSSATKPMSRAQSELSRAQSELEMMRKQAAIDKQKLADAQAHARLVQENHRKKLQHAAEAVENLRQHSHAQMEAHVDEALQKSKHQLSEAETKLVELEAAREAKEEAAREAAALQQQLEEAKQVGADAQREAEQLRGEISKQESGADLAKALAKKTTEAKQAVTAADKAKADLAAKDKEIAALKESAALAARASPRTTPRKKKGGGCCAARPKQ
jgi:hypothetical protein